MRGVAGVEGGGVKCADVRERERVDVRRDDVREGWGVTESSPQQLETGGVV